MSDPQANANTAAQAGTDADHAAPPKTRAKPGQRRLEILQAFAAMLEQPTAERVTTAALAKRLDVSEAALYRQFASKAQMLEALIDFIEDSLMGLASKVDAQGLAGRVACAQLTQLILQFAQANPGMVRVMVGDALLLEQPRLAQRIALLFDKLEAQLRGHWRRAAGETGAHTPDSDASVRAHVLMSFVRGQLLRFTRSQWRVLPTDRLDLHLDVLLG
ncbi:MAG: nucleoid occlusion factor SlmA [Burkholderiaceae bacterium]|nr:nucleoid occlusion factor SlmA [Burkholderiaceae bacterium]